jgi:hypothetical protein
MDIVTIAEILQNRKPDPSLYNSLGLLLRSHIIKNIIFSAKPPNLPLLKNLSQCENNLDLKLFISNAIAQIGSYLNPEKIEPGNIESEQRLIAALKSTEIDLLRRAFLYALQHRRNDLLPIMTEICRKNDNEYLAACRIRLMSDSGAGYFPELLDLVDKITNPRLFNCLIEGFIQMQALESEAVFGQLIRISASSTPVGKQALKAVHTLSPETTSLCWLELMHNNNSEIRSFFVCQYARLHPEQICENAFNKISGNIRTILNRGWDGDSSNNEKIKKLKKLARQSTQAEIRERAVEALNKILPENEKEFLLHFLNDESNQVVLATIMALSANPDFSSIYYENICRALKQMLLSEDPEDRIAVLKCIGALRDENLLEFTQFGLYTLLHEKNATSEKAIDILQSWSLVSVKARHILEEFQQSRTDFAEWSKSLNEHELSDYMPDFHPDTFCKLPNETRLKMLNRLNSNDVLSDSVTETLEHLRNILSRESARDYKPDIPVICELIKAIRLLSNGSEWQNLSPFLEYQHPEIASSAINSLSEDPRILNIIERLILKPNLYKNPCLKEMFSAALKHNENVAAKILNNLISSGQKSDTPFQECLNLWQNPTAESCELLIGLISKKMGNEKLKATRFFLRNFPSLYNPDSLEKALSALPDANSQKSTPVIKKKSFTEICRDITQNDTSPQELGGYLKDFFTELFKKKENIVHLSIEAFLFLMIFSLYFFSGAQPMSEPAIAAEPKIEIVTQPKEPPAPTKKITPEPEKKERMPATVYEIIYRKNAIRLQTKDNFYYGIFPESIPDIIEEQMLFYFDAIIIEPDIFGVPVLKITNVVK